MIHSNEEIADVFTILHDGVISTDQIKQSPSKWKIECKYLAELIDESFDHFYIAFQGMEELSFTPWWNDDTSDAYEKLSDVTCSLEILSGKLESGIISITFNHSSKNPNFAGGIYNFKTESIQIFDQNFIT